TPSAWAADSRAGSKPAAKVAIAFSSSPSLTHMCAPPPALTDRPTGKCNCQTPFSQGGTTTIARALDFDIALEPECIATLRPLNIRQYVRVDGGGKLLSGTGGYRAGEGQLRHEVLPLHGSAPRRRGTTRHDGCPVSARNWVCFDWGRSWCARRCWGRCTRMA